MYIRPTITVSVAVSSISVVSAVIAIFLWHPFLLFGPPLRGPFQYVKWIIERLRVRHLLQSFGHFRRGFSHGHDPRAAAGLDLPRRRRRVCICSSSSG